MHEEQRNCLAALSFFVLLLCVVTTQWTGLDIIDRSNILRVRTAAILVLFPILDSLMFHLFAGKGIIFILINRGFHLFPTNHPVHT